VIEVIAQSGLRGRGGAGFPTGTKWQITRNAPGDMRYAIGNGDEGDPGAFMDRMLLESYPFRVLEGLLIAAYAVGAPEAILYIRAEYHLAVRRVREAIRLCEERGFMGDRLLGSEFGVRVRIMEGAGAFVCGEETGLTASLEGRRGMPRLRPPYPAESGLFGRPTCINNVETLALVPWIIRNGAEAFAELGTERSKGTKIFSLTGQVRHGGLIEVPMGTTIREIVQEIGGGVPEGRRLKAIQIGGPSGGCLPAALADTPVDYEALTGAGAIMGSGGLVVLDDSNCMVDVARYFLEFTQRESCGKCTFCRVGTRCMLSVLERLCSGEGRAGDVENLEELARMVKRASLCGLGQTAPNPVLSTLRYFHDEYEAHVAGRCPAGKCRALITYRITNECIGCTKCVQQCPVGAIALAPHEVHVIDADSCIRCGTCRGICPVEAVVVD
jgi:NADH:ubiquinone oxidoreductase subunit F (NADH-binding)